MHDVTEHGAAFQAAADGGAAMVAEFAGVFCFIRGQAILPDELADKPAEVVPVEGREGGGEDDADKDAHDDIPQGQQSPGAQIKMLVPALDVKCKVTIPEVRPKLLRRVQDCSASARM